MLKADDLKVRSQNSADTSQLIEHIRYNLTNIDFWLEFDPTLTQTKVLLVSAGRSLTKHLPTIKQRQEEGYHVYCVKHSYPKLMTYGVIPDGCFILDPRPVNGISTHGKVRKDLFDSENTITKFFVASMSNPSYTDMFKEKGLKLKGWHVMVNGMEKFPETIPHAIYAGTSSATRGIGALLKMGYKDIELVAYDSDVDEPSEVQKKVVTPEGPPKYIPIQSVDSKTTFWTTGELAAQAQDLRVIPNYYFGKINLSMWEGGLGYDIFSNEQRKLFTMLGGSLRPKMCIELKVKNLLTGEIQYVETYHPAVIKDLIEVINKPL